MGCRIGLTAAVLALSGLCGCTSSGELITGYFEQMVDISDANAGDCERMGRELVSFLDANEPGFVRAVRGIDSIEPHEAEAISKSSAKLHQISERCHNESIEQFKTKLAQIILQDVS